MDVLTPLCVDAESASVAAFSGTTIMTFPRRLFTSTGTSTHLANTRQ